MTTRLYPFLVAAALLGGSACATDDSFVDGDACDACDNKAPSYMTNDAPLVSCLLSPESVLSCSPNPRAIAATGFSEVELQISTSEIVRTGWMPMAFGSADDVFTINLEEDVLWEWGTRFEIDLRADFNPVTTSNFVTQDFERKYIAYPNEGENSNMQDFFPPSEDAGLHLMSGLGQVEVLYASENGEPLSKHFYVNTMVDIDGESYRDRMRLDDVSQSFLNRVYWTGDKNSRRVTSTSQSSLMESLVVDRPMTIVLGSGGIYPY